MKLLQIGNLSLFSTFKIYCSDYPRIKYPISYTLLPLIYSLLFDAHAVFAPKWTLTKVSVIACIVVVIFSCPNSNMRINQRTSNFVFPYFVLRSEYQIKRIAVMVMPYYSFVKLLHLRYYRVFSVVFVFSILFRNLIRQKAHHFLVWLQ